VHDRERLHVHRLVCYQPRRPKREMKEAHLRLKLITKTGDYRENAPVPWHEAKNIGDTTFSLLLVEKKCRLQQSIRAFASNLRRGRRRIAPS
jgi:hypothetical protein